MVLCIIIAELNLDRIEAMDTFMVIRNGHEENNAVDIGLLEIKQIRLLRQSMR